MTVKELMSQLEKLSDNDLPVFGCEPGHSSTRRDEYYNIQEVKLPDPTPRESWTEAQVILVLEQCWCK